MPSHTRYTLSHSGHSYSGHSRDDRSGQPRQWRSVSLAAILCLLACVGCDPKKPDGETSNKNTPQPAANNTNPSGSNDKKESASSDAVQPWFRNVSSEANFEFTYRNGQEANESSILESLGGGIGVIDVDQDGRFDLFLTGGGNFPGNQTVTGLPSGLFLQQQLGRFTPHQSAAYVDQSPHYSHGIAVGDYDNDGFSDCVITGYGGLTLFHNQGDGTFQQSTTEAGLLDTQWSSSAAWGDLNGDQCLDLYVAHYVNWSFENHPRCPGPKPDTREICSPRDFRGVQDILYLSNADGTFRNATADSKLAPEGKGLGVVLADLNLDQKLDIYVANDTVSNFLYINQGNALFREVADQKGVATDDEGIPNGSMGVDVCDYNRDGRPDVWVANYERESFALYRNEGEGFFLHVSRATGITALGGLFVGFGTAFLDIDGDADEDVIVANGHVIKYPSHSTRKQLPLILENRNQRFVRLPVPTNDYFALPHEGRGLAVVDYDNNAQPDIAISNVNEAAVLLQHQQEIKNCFSLRLIGTQSSRDPIGATATLQTEQGSLLRMVKGGGSYLSSHDPRLFFAWPDDARPKSLVVQWPSGLSQTLDFQSILDRLAASKSSSLTLVEPFDRSSDN